MERLTPAYVRMGLARRRNTKIAASYCRHVDPLQVLLRAEPTSYWRHMAQTLRAGDWWWEPRMLYYFAAYSYVSTSESGPDYSVCHQISVDATRDEMDYIGMKSSKHRYLLVRSPTCMYYDGNIFVIYVETY